MLRLPGLRGTLSEVIDNEIKPCNAVCWMSCTQKNNDDNKVSARRKLADYLTKLGTMYCSAAFTWEDLSTDTIVKSFLIFDSWFKSLGGCSTLLRPKARIQRLFILHCFSDRLRWNTKGKRISKTIGWFNIRGYSRVNRKLYLRRYLFNIMTAHFSTVH